MIIFPAIDIIGGKAVRLFKGEYDKKTEYGDPAYFAEQFKDLGATHIHVVDLDGAKSGATYNYETVKEIKKRSGLFTEVGGGIRNIDTIKRYLSLGIDRVILGTAAIRDRDFLAEAVKEFGDKIAVGADVKSGYIAVNGWLEDSGTELFAFLNDLVDLGVKTVICTDVGRDGAMQGANLSLYETISSRYDLNLIASGGVSDLSDVKRLKDMGVYGAIIGKAYYTGAIDLKTCIEVAK